MITVVLVATVLVFVALASVRGRRLGQAAVRRCQQLLRRQRHERDVATVRRIPSRTKTPVHLPRCDQCHEVFNEIAELREHLETHR